MTLAYQSAGSGSPLVLLHGIGHRRQAWDAVLSRLAAEREVITVDLPGHGGSPPLDGTRPTAEALAAELTGLFDELGLTRPHVAGNSLGGLLALEIAAAGRAASVTALSPAGFWRSDAELAYARSVFRLMQALGARLAPLSGTLAASAAGRAVLYSALVRRPSLLSPAQAEGDMRAFLQARPAMEAILALAEGASFTGSIPAGVPVLIAWGDSDRLLPRRQALLARQRLPQATFVRLPGCGHVPMTDNPALVASVLLRGSAA